jgi:hypothetical protein
MADLRYAILHHEGIDQPHFDLMFETAPGSALATWRASSWRPTGPLVIEQMPDHRRDFLTLEGKLTGNRGHVRRVEEGTCSIEREGEDRWTIRLHSQSKSKMFLLRLEKESDGSKSWRLTLIPSPSNLGEG